MASELESLKIPDKELERLRAACAGERESLAQSIGWFYPVFVAMAFVRTREVRSAVGCAERLVRGLFKSLLAGEVAPENLVREAAQRLSADAPQATGGDGDEPLHSLHGAGKLVRRRAAWRALGELPEREAVGLVLRYHAGWSAEQMVGIVGPGLDEVRELLIRGHRAVIEAMRQAD